MRILPLRVRAGYGVAETGLAAVEVLIQVYLLKFYIETVGLETRLAGLALALAVIWDALTDPVMGKISDASHFRAGRRRVYILGGSLALALFFPLLFHPPALASMSGKFFFLLGSYVLVNTAMTISAVPHTAMGGELTPDPNERTELFGFRLLAGNVGFLAGTILPGLYIAYAGPDTSATASRGWSAWVVGGLVFVSGAVTFFATRGRDLPAAATEPSPARAAIFDPREILSALGNRYFAILLAAYFVATIGRTMNASIALLYYEHFLALDEKTVALYVLAPFMAFISVSVALWVWISRRYGKKGPAIVGVAGLGLMTVLAYPNFEPGGLLGPIFAAFLGGLLVGAVILLDSLVGDIVDYDLLRTGRQREGLYFGFWRMSAKAARALGLALTSFALAHIGFRAGAVEQPAAVGDQLALLFGPGVGVFFLAGAAIFAFLPWSTARHDRIRALLERRQATRGRATQGRTPPRKKLG